MGKGFSCCVQVHDPRGWGGGVNACFCPLKCDIIFWPPWIPRFLSGCQSLLKATHKPPSDFKASWSEEMQHVCFVSFHLKTWNESAAERTVLWGGLQSDSGASGVSHCCLEGVHCWISTMALTSLVVLVPCSQFVLTVGVKGLTGKGNRGNPVPGGIGTWW